MSSMLGRRGLTVAALSTALVMSLAATSVAQDAEKVELTMLADNTEGTMAWTEALVAAYEEMNPNVSISVEWRPGGGEGDNIVKTRLATGEMADIFCYNSGFAAPGTEPDRDPRGPVGRSRSSTTCRLVPSHRHCRRRHLRCSGGHGHGRRHPLQQEDLRGPRPLGAHHVGRVRGQQRGHQGRRHRAGGASFADTWTSQLFVLADYYNVQAAEPDFAEQYTSNQTKYATTPAAMAGFQHPRRPSKRVGGRKTSTSTTYERPEAARGGQDRALPDADLRAGATIADTYPEAIGDIGFFAQPGDRLTRTAPPSG